jgi:GNAT superfamily N-acetyltransferase
MPRNRASLLTPDHAASRATIWINPRNFCSGEGQLNMIDFGIRPGRPADLPALRDVYRRASLSNSGDVAQLLAHPDVLLLTDHGVNEGRTRVATQLPDHIVGFATTYRTGRVLELEDLFVDPDWMRRGVGRALVQDVVILAAQENIRRVEVTANSHALSFYENVGFVHDGDVDTPFGSGLRMHLDTAAGHGMT